MVKYGNKAGSRQQAAGSRHLIKNTHLKTVNSRFFARTSFFISSSNFNHIDISQHYHRFSLCRAKVHYFQKKFWSIIWCLVPFICFSQTTHAALSVSTFNTIKGSEPYLLLSDGITKLSGLDELMGFSMPKRDGSYAREQIEVSMASMTLIAPKDMKYNDVVPLVTANGTLQNIPGVTVGDADGDSTLISNTSVGGQMKATWYNGGVAIQPDQLNVSLDPCGGPYKLTIEISTEVIANTTYGDPNIKSYGKGSVSYSFVPKDITICYLQPKDMRIYTGGLIAYSEGYNPAIWSPGNGFSMQLMNEKSVMFPTTGFKNAAFSLIGSGNDQSRYRCSSSDDGVKIGLSGTANTKLGEKCTVTYNSLKRADFNAGGSTPTIIMEYNLGEGTWMEIGNYTIPTPNLWLIGLGRIVYGDASSLKESTSFPALDACRMAVDGNATPATTQSQALDLTAQGEAWRQKYLFRMDMS